MIACIESDPIELPDKILDLGTLAITIDNRGIAQLSVNVLTKNIGVIYGPCALDVGEGAIFNGTIVGDHPSELLGTEYYEHRVTAIGMVE